MVGVSAPSAESSWVSLAADGEDLQVRRRLVDRLNLGEQVQVAEGPVPPGPLDRLRRLIRGGVARLHRLQRLGQPLVVMGKQLVHPFVGARGDGAVGRQQPGIRQRQRPGQRAEVVQQGRPVARRLDPIDGVMCGST